MTAGIQDAPEKVLSTMREDGSRVWLRPRLSRGRFLTARRAVAYLLMVLFFALPFAHVVLGWFGIHSRQWMLLDIPARRFTILGYTFLPTDTLLLALFMLIVFVGIFLFTALLGRLWCGWACPQTVYMEFLYRPLERLFEGTAGKGGPRRKDAGDWRKAGYFVVALVVSLIPAHTFLAYFVPAEKLLAWVTGNPLAHPTAFVVMAVTTALMMFDFYYFREQLCLIACPYGRFQSVLLDKWSMIVTYDPRRGEPRGKLGRGTEAQRHKGTEGTAVALPIAEPVRESKQGDCVDCGLCVVTCPTGIDIRDGLQMECINCTQCIDACDAVMDRIRRPRGLIRYGSQAGIEGEKRRLLRPRVVLYPLLLAVLTALWLLVFSSKGDADVTVLRNLGSPFVVLADGTIGNSLRVKIVNRTEREATYRFEVVGVPEATVTGENPVTVSPGTPRTASFLVSLPRRMFAGGECDVRVRIAEAGGVQAAGSGGAKGFSRDVTVRLLGPAGDLTERGARP